MPGLRRALVPAWVAVRQAAPGLAMAVALALLARALAQALAHGVGGLPKFPLSPVMCAVLLGMLWRNSVGVPAWATRGLDWTMHRLLRVGIALVGLRLTLAGATAIAATAAPVAISCLAVALQRQEGSAGSPSRSNTRPPLVPFFVLGFVAFILVRTAGDALYGAATPLWQALINTGYTTSDLFLTCGMTAVGLSVSFTDMWRIGWRPLVAGFVVATLVGACSLLLTCGLAHFLT